MGRPPVPIRDRLFSCVTRYSTVSCRRFACDLEDAVKEGFLSHFHYNKVDMYLENED